MPLDVSDDEVGALEDAFWATPDKSRLEAQARTWLTWGAMPATARWRLTVLLALLISRRGDKAEAVRRLDAARGWAVEHGDAAVLARSERGFAIVFDQMGDAALALEHAAAANAAISESDSPGMRAAVRLCLADALGTGRTQEQARGHYDRAEQLAGQAAIPGLRALILNNRAYSEHVAGHDENALVAADALVAELAATGATPDDSERDTLATIWLRAGRLDAARDILAIYLDDRHDVTSHVDASISGLLTLAQVHRASGQLPDAARCVGRAQDICRGIDWPTAAVEIDRERAELLAARGSYAEAFELFKAYHDRIASMRSSQREAHGRVLQILFEADETRQDRAADDAFPQRDPLTGLHNRRHADEQLPRLLAQAIGSRGSLLVVLVDLDRFHDIKGFLTPQIGDEVLRAVGGILAGVAARRPYCLSARVGGDEFLLAVPGISDREAAGFLEDTRSAIEDHGWRELCGGRKVTASIGAAFAPVDGTQHSALLRRADERLHVAKLNGRNRVAFVDDARQPVS